MNITLRIKRVYFDLILAGHKLIEYRDCKEYYDRMFVNKESITSLTLHYQGERQLRCKVIQIRRISIDAARRLTPKEFTKNDIQFGTHVYALYLKDPRLLK